MFLNNTWDLQQCLCSINGEVRPLQRDYECPVGLLLESAFISYVKEMMVCKKDFQ